MSVKKKSVSKKPSKTFIYLVRDGDKERGEFYRYESQEEILNEVSDWDANPGGYPVYKAELIGYAVPPDKATFKPA